MGNTVLRSVCCAKSGWPLTLKTLKARVSSYYLWTQTIPAKELETSCKPVRELVVCRIVETSIPVGAMKLFE